MTSRVLTCCVLSAGLLTIGCQTGEVGRVRPEARAAITHAATAEYPGDAQTSEDVRLSAVVNPRLGDLILYNLGDNTVPAGSVWVNGAYVSRFNGVPARGSSRLKYSNFVEAGAGTRDLQRAREEVRTVEVQTEQGLFTVQGPAMQQ